MYEMNAKSVGGKMRDMLPELMEDALDEKMRIVWDAAKNVQMRDAGNTRYSEVFTGQWSQPGLWS